MPGGMSPQGRPTPTRPPAMDLAVRLMYAGAVLQVLAGLASLLQNRDDLRAQIRDQLESQGTEVTDATVNTAMAVSFGAAIVFGLIYAGLWVLMAVFNGRGKSWARIVATILGGLNIVLTAFGVIASSTAGMAGGIVATVFQVTIALLGIVILVLLWRRESSDYYAAMSGPRTGY
jgi:uncharacterized membrane protein